MQLGKLGNFPNELGDKTHFPEWLRKWSLLLQFSEMGVRVLALVGLVVACGVRGEIFDLTPFGVQAQPDVGDVSPSGFSTSQVDPASIQKAQLQLTLEESLRSLPGVFILNSTNFAQDTRIAIRGFGARADFGIRGIRLFVDGIPATTPDGQGEVDGIDFGSAQQIQVIRGSGAAFFGAAAGGAILIESESPRVPPFMEARLTMGDFGSRRYQIKAAGQYGKVASGISLSRFQSDGFRDHNQTESTLLSGQTVFQPSENVRYRFLYQLIDYPLQMDPGGLTLAEATAQPRQARDRNVQFDAGESVRQQRFGLQYRKEFEDGRILALNFHTTWRDFDNRLPFEPGGQVEFQRNFLGFRGLFRSSPGAFRWSLGADVDHQQDDRRNFNNENGTRGDRVLDQKERVRSGGIFFHFEQEISNSFSINGALRRDEVRFRVSDSLLGDGDDSGTIEFEDWSPFFGVQWRVDSQVSFFFNYTESFETPTTTELDNPQGGGFNPDIQSQTARTGEVGLQKEWKLARGTVFFDMALYRTEISDSLVGYELPEFPGREFYRNAGESSRQGVELQAIWDSGVGLLLQLDWTYSDFQYENFRAGDHDYSGNRLPGIPENFGGITVRHTHPNGFFAEWQTRWVGNFFADDANRTRVPPHSVSHLRLAWRFTTKLAEWEPFLAIQNLLDEEYFDNIRLNAFGGRYYEPAPGRNLYAGLRARF